MTTIIDPKWGEIYLADLGTPKGHEQGGIRPVLITSSNINNKKSGSVNYVAMTSKQKNNLPVHELFRRGEVDGLYMDTIVMTEQAGNVDKDKLIKPMGRLTKEQIKKIAKAYILQRPFLRLAFEDEVFINSDILERVMS